MFSAIRIIIIVGVIFYYSPLRNPGELTARPDLPTDWSLVAPDEAAPDGDGAAEALWKALPESAKRAIIDRIMAATSPPAAPARTAEAVLAPPTDTLEPEDFRPAWRGETKVSRPQS